MKQTLATLRLFNAVIRTSSPQVHTQRQTKGFIRSGVILDNRVKITSELTRAIITMYGVTGDYANKTFHKSWDKVKNAPIEQLVYEQILHYITTYGFESVGLYDNNLVYIPTELYIPDFNFDDMPLLYIKGITLEELVDLVLNLADGVALGDQTLDDLMEIIEAYPESFKAHYESIGNRELRSRMASTFKIVPTEPTEWLRYVVTELTGNSLLIKNRQTKEALATANVTRVDELVKTAPKDLAKIFYRNRVIFAALKKRSTNKTFFNRLNKAAKTSHVPMPVDYLNDITRQIKENELDLKELETKLKGASNFRKIRLAYALFRRLHSGDSGDSIVYTVRNGRGWATDFNWDTKLLTATRDALRVVIFSLAGSMNVEGKAFYIPEDVHYAVPSSEKMFTGNFPSGTSIGVRENLIVGIYWEDNDERRVDLDLSVVSESGKFGWDEQWRGKGTLFSGDITSAPNGATELFHITREVDEARLLLVNDYNFRKDSAVDARIMVGTDVPNTFKRNYMLDPTKVVASANTVIDNKQTVLGVIKSVDGENRVYLNKVAVGNSITSSTESSTQVREYMVRCAEATIQLADLLELAGAEVYRTVGAEENAIDLSPEFLTKSTIIDLVK